MKSSSNSFLPIYFTLFLGLFASTKVASCGQVKEEVTATSAPEKIVFRNSPQGGTIGECIRLSVSFEDSIGNTPTNKEAQTVSMSSSSGLFYSDSACTIETTSTTIEADQTSTFVFFRSLSVGTSRILAAKTPDSGLREASLTLEIRSDATRVVFADSVVNGLYSTCIPIGIKIVNGSVSNSQLGIALPVTFTARYNEDGKTLGEFFKESRCKESENILTLAPNQSGSTIYFLTNVPGEYKVSALIPKGAGIEGPSTLALNARTELYGTWTSPCMETALNAVTRVQKIVRFDDLTLDYIVNYYSGQSGLCIEQEKTHWTNFTATYTLLQPENSASSGTPSATANSSASPINILYKTSCVGIKAQAKAAEYRANNTCGINQWREDANACNDTTNKSDCENGTAVESDTEVFDIFGYGSSDSNTLLFSAAGGILPSAANSTTASRPTELSNLLFTLSK